MFKLILMSHTKWKQSLSFYSLCTLPMQDVAYRINQRTRVCTTSQPPTPFRRIEVPPNATYYGTFYVGSTTEPLAGFLVNSFGGNTENGEDNDHYDVYDNYTIFMHFQTTLLGRYVGSWTSVDCVPVTDAYISSQTGFVHWR